MGSDLSSVATSFEVNCYLTEDNNGSAREQCNIVDS